MLSQISKRIFDLTLLMLTSPIWVPLGIIVLVLVRIKLGKPVLYKQVRAGYLGKPFTIIKFRTMIDARDSTGKYLPDEERLTPFGSVIRRMSFDEIPEAWNVLRGEMSLVGPRPLPMSYLARYSEFQARRHEAKPGMTGWAQINGRNAINWNDKFKLDVWYVNNRSLWLDTKIIFMTLMKLFRREGINAEGCATMPEFTGADR